MDIPCINNVVLDTNKMSDLKALIAEKSYELHKLLCDNNIRHLMAAEGHNSHWHMKGQVEQKSEDVMVFWGYINMICGFLSNGNIYLSFKPNQQPLIEGEEWKNK